MRRICWLLAIATLVAACSPKPEANEEPAAAADATQSVGFELIRAGEGEGQFRLSNSTPRTIAFGSTQETSEGAHARDVHLKCKTAGSDQWDEGPRSMEDSPVSVVDVPPGSHATVIVLWEPGVLQHYEGGHCRVDLKLQDGSIIESDEFSW